MLLILFSYRFYCSVYTVIVCFILLMPHEIKSIVFQINVRSRRSIHSSDCGLSEHSKL